MKSWIPYAAESQFPLQNIPFGVMAVEDHFIPVATRIGDFVVDVTLLHRHGLLNVSSDGSLEEFGLFLESGTEYHREVRAELQRLFSENCADLRDSLALRKEAVLPVEIVLPLLPDIPAYTDFYSSIQHASNVGKMFRDPENPLLPNWKHIPIAYNGKVTSLITDGDPVVRPNVQTKAKDAALPTFGACQELDFELELGAVISASSDLADPPGIEHADEFLFGLVLVNDWSARDAQRWEYQPLGPFLAKSFATSVSPWIVTFDALEEFAVPHPQQDPEPLPYLRSDELVSYDLRLEVLLKTQSMDEAVTICKTNARNLYWTFAQQFAHMVSNGAPVWTGELFASGTISGETPDSFGSMLELAWKGERPIQLPNGETRVFLEDGDEVILRGYGQGDGYRIGFGDLRSRILPARPL
jgi:fumarylacetoacetase